MNGRKHLHLTQEDIENTRKKALHENMYGKEKEDINFHSVTDQLPTLDFTVENIPENQKQISARLTHLENTLQRWWDKLNYKKAKKRSKKEKKYRLPPKLGTSQEERLDTLLLECICKGVESNFTDYDSDGLQEDGSLYVDKTLQANEVENWNLPEHLVGRKLKAHISLEVKKLKWKD